MARAWALSTLGAVILVTMGGIAYIHHSQTVERQNLRRGVQQNEELYQMKLKEFQGQQRNSKSNLLGKAEQQ
ncbi:hypothetical protein WJX84_006251 [Apatococcus fuscideae]|uniref:Uncharacterized protein n=1 Tax=Apatococcus fuscideae TaxID=2026836 RepID=A0AAW1STI7_9CHLO